MLTLIIGLIIWMDAHFFKRVLPEVRMAINEKLGAGRARGIMSIIIIFSVVLMIIGYRSWSAPQLYTPPSFLFPVAMIASIIAVTLMGAGKSKSRIRNKLRHPMLTGVIIWACAHLSVRGDMASVVLFGGMILWAIFSIMLINYRQGPWRPVAFETSLRGDIRLVVIGLILSAIMFGIHLALING